MTYLITLQYSGLFDIPQQGSSRSVIVIQQLIAHLQQSALKLVEAMPVQTHNFNEQDIADAFISEDTLATFVLEVARADAFTENHHYLSYVLDVLREGNAALKNVYKQADKTIVVITNF